MVESLVQLADVERALADFQDLFLLQHLHQR